MRYNLFTSEWHFSTIVSMDPKCDRTRQWERGTSGCYETLRTLFELLLSWSKPLSVANPNLIAIHFWITFPKLISGEFPMFPKRNYNLGMFSPVLSVFRYLWVDKVFLTITSCHTNLSLLKWRPLSFRWTYLISFASDGRSLNFSNGSNWVRNAIH